MSTSYLVNLLLNSLNSSVPALQKYVWRSSVKKRKVAWARHSNKTKKLKKKALAPPGIEPGLARPQRDVIPPLDWLDNAFMHAVD